MAKLILAPLLKKKGLSKRKFAKLLNIDYPSVFRYFRDGYDPKLSTLELWAKALGVRVRDLIVEE
jgi:transcriptional regulator with XRE-family HTH domain